MREFKFDAASWTKKLDIYHALREPLEMPDWHGNSINALVDSVIWGGINGVNPPYRIVISNVASVPNDVRAELELIVSDMRRHRQYFQQQKGEDVEAEFELRD